jgi:hypothetical protein
VAGTIGKIEAEVRSGLSLTPSQETKKKTPWTNIILVIAYSGVAIVLQVPEPLSEEFIPGWQTLFSSPVQCISRFRNRSLSYSKARFTVINMSLTL